MGRLFAVSAVAFGGSFLLFSLTRSIPVAGFAYFVNGFSWTCTSVTGVSMVQALVRDDVRGRVMSVYSMNNSVAQLNSISLGVIADRFGMVAMMVSVTGFLTASTAVLAGLVPSLRSLDRKMAGVREEERRSEAAAAGG
ncbi:MAG: MFS transporter, partial [Dehalococcoidia bacterium]